MTTYQWLCIFGVQALVTALIGVGVGLISNAITRNAQKKKDINEEAKKDMELLKSAMQVSLRKDLYDMYDVAVRNQFVTSDEQKLFLSLYESYHSLKENGVMDAIKDQYMDYKVIN